MTSRQYRLLGTAKKFLSNSPLRTPLACFALRIVATNEHSRHIFHPKRWKMGGNFNNKKLNIKVKGLEKRFPPLFLVKTTELP